MTTTTLLVFFCDVNRVTDPSQKENLGIIVHYKVKVKLCLGPLGGDVVAELPFILMHPKPLEELAQSARTDETSNHRSSVKPAAEDHNLIQLDAYVSLRPRLIPRLTVDLFFPVQGTKRGGHNLRGFCTTETTRRDCRHSRVICSFLMFLHA